MPRASRIKPVTEYLNVYTSEFSAGHPSLQSAKEVRQPDKLAIVKLTFDKQNQQVTAEIVK